MKQRYYFRGLGIGILVATIIVSLSAHNKKSMTDEEVKARARQLGMVESTVLSNISGNNSQGSTEKTVSDGDEPEASEGDGNTEETEPEKTEPEVTVSDGDDTDVSDGDEVTVSGGDDTDVSDGDEVTVSDGNDTGDVYTLIINSGESSVTVSKSLEAAGFVESASKYDRFLCENGYDKKIRVGTYEIPKGASEEEIARMITGGN